MSTTARLKMLAAALLLLASCAGNKETKTAQEEDFPAATAASAPEHQTHDKHAHKHGPKCGHKSWKHEDHTDYAHDGHWHASHDGHWDEHPAPTRESQSDPRNPSSKKKKKK